MMQRRSVKTGTVWERKVGYSRAVRVGDTICVSGTTAVDQGGAAVCVGDPYGQTKFILLKIERSLVELGASLNDVVRTRIFVTDISRWEQIGRAHEEILGEAAPATTMVEVSRLVGSDLLVEIEADAVTARSPA